MESLPVIISFSAYFFVLLAIGLFSHKRSKTQSDFALGDRSLNFWVTALSAHASDMSAWLFIGFPTSLYLAGVSGFWCAIGLLVGMFLTWHYIATKLRVETEKYNCYTLSSFFEKKFEDSSGILRTATAILTVVFLTHYLAAGLMAMGMLFESLFGFDYTVGIVIASAIIAVYTMFGGFVTVAWTDLFQGVFLLAMITIVPAVAFTKIDGFNSILEAAQAKNVSLSLIKGNSFQGFIEALLLAIGWGVGYFGLPHVLTKFMGIKKPEELRKSKVVGMIWQTLALTAAAAIGLIALAYFKQGISDPQLIFVTMVKELFNPYLSGFIFCGVLAANMSTMDSQILVSSTVITEDLYKRLIAPQATSSQLLSVSRLGVLAITLLSLVLSLTKSASIFDSVGYAWSGLGSSFGPIVILSLYSKTSNRFGAIAGIVAGGATSGLWPFINPLLLDQPLMPMVPGFFVGLLTILGVSWLTRAPALAEPTLE